MDNAWTTLNNVSNYLVQVGSEMPDPDQDTREVLKRASTLTQSLHVILKVKVKNEHLEAGRYRQGILQNPEASRNDPPRRKRGRPRIYPIGTPRSRRTNTRTTKRGVPTYGARQIQGQAKPINGIPKRQAIRQPADHLKTNQEFSLKDFEAPTTYGFPLRVLKLAKEAWPVERLPSKMLREQRVIIADNASPLEDVEYQTESLQRLDFRDALASTVPDKEAPSAGMTILHRAKLPNTAGFWMDWFVAEQAFKSHDLDFKLLCLHLIQQREKSEIPRVTLENPKAGSIWYGSRIDDVRVNGLLNTIPQDTSTSAKESSMTWFGLRARRDASDPRVLLQSSDWDSLLSSVIVRRNKMRKERQRKRQFVWHQAGWAVWEEKQRRKSRGEFGEENNGKWVVRAPPKGNIIKEIRDLGYCRKGVDSSHNSSTSEIGIHWEVTTRLVDDTRGQPTLYTRTDNDGVSDAIVRKDVKTGRRKREQGETAISCNDEIPQIHKPNSVERRLFTAKSLMEMENI